MGWGVTDYPQNDAEVNAELMTEDQLEQQFRDWAYDKPIDKPEDYDFLEMLSQESRDALQTALFEISLGHEMNGSLRSIADELNNIMYLHFEERVL